MKPHFLSTANLTEAIVTFAQFVRKQGLNVGIQETQEALRAAEAGLLTNHSYFRHALAALFCTSPEERHRFDQLFERYWGTDPVTRKEDESRPDMHRQITQKGTGTVVFLGKGKTEPGQEDANSVSGANELERLQEMDFAKLNEVEARQLEEIAQKLFSEMAIRLRRRMKESRRQGPVHLRRTIRRGLGAGGELIELFRKARRPKKQRLIVLLDVSGSMDKYSFFLLRFVCALRENFRQLEAFMFSTSLLRITPALRSRHLDQLMTTLTRQVDNWSSGTKIGECLQTFNDNYGKQILNGSPIVIILSDGLDTGTPELLATELEKIRRRARKIVWLNPLKGNRYYEPMARGMKAALPSITTFRSAHSLKSLLELETILRQV